MTLSSAQKLLLLIAACAYVLSDCATAHRDRTWGWGSNHTGWGWGWGRGRDQDGSNNQTGWGWGRGRDQDGSNNRNGWGWGWGQGSGSGSNNESDWWGPHRHRLNATAGPRKIVVGGEAGWQYGFNYSDWAFKNGPFYVNDVLVFKYDPPAPFTHSVYQLPNIWSYLNCDIKSGKMIGNVSDGAGDGFEFVLRKWQPYYFACGQRDGIHCNNGTMKFFLMPIIRPWF